MIKSVTSNVPATRYASVPRIWSKQGCFIMFPLNNSLVWILCPSRKRVTSFLDSPLPGFTVTRKPNQDGTLFSADCGRSSRSCTGKSALCSLSQFSLLRRIKDGNFFSCSHPMAACMSVTFRLYPKWLYTYLWS